MAGTTSEEFKVRFLEDVGEAMRKSRAAWEGYCNRAYRKRDDGDAVNMLPGASLTAAASSTERVQSPSNSFSHFLTLYAVQNVVLIPPSTVLWESLMDVVTRGNFGGSRWGHTDMMLTLSESQMDRQECLQALAHFRGGVYLASKFFLRPEISSSVLSSAEALAFFKALCSSSTPPHTLSMIGEHVFDLAPSPDEHAPHTDITLEHIMMALRLNPNIQNLALSHLSPTLTFDNILLTDGISLDRLCLNEVHMTDEFCQALPGLKDSGFVTHSLTLDGLKLASNTYLLSEWKLSFFSQFLQWPLKYLSLLNACITPPELVDCMMSLRESTSTSLHSLSLGNLDFVSEEITSAQLVGVIVDALHESTLPILHIHQRGFFNRFTSPAIDAQLLRNQQKRANTGFELLEAQHKVAAAAVRMFICGDPYAGKTTMLSTLSSVCGSTSLAQKVKGCFLSLPCGGQHNKRTQGIEIQRITQDGIQLSLWDLAGQKEFHAFHDLMFPDSSGDSGSPTIFMFVWSPVKRSGDARLKNVEDFKNNLLYWLKFIASKTRQSNILRKLFVVITHKDEVQLLDILFTKSFVNETVAANFETIIEVVQVLTLDARDPQDVKPLASCVFETARAVLEGVKIYGVCSDVSKYILSSQQARKADHVKWKPIISWEDFSALCESKFQVTDIKIQKAIAYSLNDSGDIIYLGGNMPYLVLAPNWFCRKVMGNLVHLSESNSSMGFVPISNGYTNQRYLEGVLRITTESRVEGSTLVSIMEAMHLCHKISDDKIFIPAMLSKSTTLSSRQWRTFSDVDGSESHYTYVGRRLECDRDNVTFLTPGLFPVVQVVFEKAFSGEEAQLTMVEECIHILFLEMEVIIECGLGKQGHVIDVMVRASAETINDGSTLAYVEKEIVQTLIRVCAQPVGNQGVTLVESVIRSECLHGPALLQERNDQCVLVHILQQNLRKRLEAGAFDSRRLQYFWRNSPGMQKSAHSFVELLGFEVYMQELMSYKESLQNASVSLSSHVPAIESNQLPSPGSGDSQMQEVNADVASTSTAPTGQEGDEVREEMKASSSFIQLCHAMMITNDLSMTSVESYQPEEKKNASTDEREGQTVETMGKEMVMAIYREVRSMNVRLRAMDARQQEMEKKTDEMMHSIEMMRNKLLPGIRAMVEKCFTFAVESETGQAPRFVHLVDRDQVGGTLKRRTARATLNLFKGVKEVYIELLCEHKEAPHQVDAQDGLRVTIVDDKDAFMVKALPHVKGFLKMLTLVAKVGAHVVAGAGSHVPDFAQVIGLVFDTPNALDSLSRSLTSTPVSAATLEGWQEWLLSVLDMQGGGSRDIIIYKKFKLRRFRFPETGKVAWLCDEHYPH